MLFLVDVLTRRRRELAAENGALRVENFRLRAENHAQALQLHRAQVGRVLHANVPPCACGAMPGGYVALVDEGGYWRGVEGWCPDCYQREHGIRFRDDLARDGQPGAGTSP